MANRRDVEIDLIGRDHTGNATRSAGNNLDQLKRKLNRFNADAEKAGDSSGESFSRRFFNTAKKFGATAKVIGGSWAIALGAVFVAKASTYMAALAPLAIGTLGAIPTIVLAKTDKQVQKHLKSLKSRMLALLKDVSKPFKPGLLRAIEVIEHKAKQLGAPLSRLFKAIGDALPQLSAGAMDALTIFLDSISSESVKSGLKEWGKQLPGIARSLGKFIDKIMADPEGTSQAIKDMASDLKQLADSATSIAGALDRAGGAWKRFSTKVDEFENSTGKDKGGPLGGMANAVERNIRRAGLAIQRGWNKMVSTVSRKAKELVSKAAAGVSNLWGRIKGSFVRTHAGVISSASNMVSRFASWLARLPGRAAGAVSGLWGRISGAFSRAVSSAKAAASRLVSGFISVLRGLPGQAMAALSGLGSRISGKLSGIVSGARSALGGLASKLGFSGGDGGWSPTLGGGGSFSAMAAPSVSVAAPIVDVRNFIDGRQFDSRMRSTVIDENKRAAWRARVGRR